MSINKRLDRLEAAQPSGKPDKKKIIEWLEDDHIIERWEPLEPGDKPGVTVNWDPPQESEK